MKNKNDLNVIVDMLQEENLTLIDFCKIGAKLFHVTITASVSVSPETVTETVSETAPVPATTSVPQQKQEEETSVVKTEEPDTSANIKTQINKTQSMSAEDQLFDMSVSIKGEMYVSINDLVDLIGCNRLTFNRRYPKLIENAIWDNSIEYDTRQKFVKLDEVKSILFFDSFDDLCSVEECGTKMGLGVGTVFRIIRENNLPYLIRDKKRVYNIKQVSACRKKYEDWSLLHDGRAPGGNRVMAKLIV